MARRKKSKPDIESDGTSDVPRSVESAVAENLGPGAPTVQPSARSRETGAASDPGVLTLSEFARLLHVFAHMVERSAQQAAGNNDPGIARVRKVKAREQPRTDLGEARARTALRKLGMLP